jgi:UDP-GlcNAc:undecaprenyl-phosphate GlcNAc-1-phosphate transferase
MLAILFQIILTYIIIHLSKKLNLLDFPNKRKLHTHPTPYTGGIIISTTYLFIFFNYKINIYFLYLILNISLITCFFGFIDDYFSIKPIQKLLLQLIPIFFLINNEIYLNDLGSYNSIGTLSLGVFGKIFTILACLLVINATNYSDGIDGLLGTIFSSIIFMFFIYFIFENKIQDGLFLLFLIYPIIIFLFFNFGLIKNQKIFLGDCGSSYLGFILGFLSICLYKYENIHPALIIWPLAYIVYDFFSTNILRLFYNKEKIFFPGHDHLHYELIQIFKINKIKTVSIIVFLNFLFSLSGLFFYKYFNNEISILLFVFIFFLYLGIRFKIRKIKLVNT